MIKSQSLNDINNENIDSMKIVGGNKSRWSGKFSRFVLIAYIFLKYPIKFGLLFSLSSILYYIVKQVYSYGCQAVAKFISFFQIILDPGDFNLVLFSVPDIFNVFMAFLDLFIGIIYLGISILFFILLGLVTIPFNIIFAF
jgi:hypothetical protein